MSFFRACLAVDVPCLLAVYRDMGKAQLRSRNYEKSEVKIKG